MTKLNWRDASKELPEEECGWMRLCLIVLKTPDNDRYAIQSYYDEDHGWDEKDIPDGELVTHWIYADEIPLPEDK